MGCVLIDGYRIGSSRRCIVGVRDDYVEVVVHGGRAVGAGRPDTECADVSVEWRTAVGAGICGEG